MTKKARYQVQYRNGNYFMKLTDHPTRKAAEEYAKQSQVCLRNGYQIIKFFIPN